MSPDFAARINKPKQLHIFFTCHSQRTYYNRYLIAASTDHDHHQTASRETLCNYCPRAAS